MDRTTGARIPGGGKDKQEKIASPTRSQERFKIKLTCPSGQESSLLWLAVGYDAARRGEHRGPRLAGDSGGRSVWEKRIESVSERDSEKG